MLDVLLLGAVALLQDNRPPPVVLDPPQGPTAYEERTLSQPHRNMKPGMFPDLAVKDLRVSGDTLYVLVSNDGATRSKGGIRIAADALVGGFKVAAPVVRSQGLKARESRWVAVRGFSARSAAASGASVFALEDASQVSATVLEAAGVSGMLDRSGQACSAESGCGGERNLGNNGLRAEGQAIARGRP